MDSYLAASILVKNKNNYWMEDKMVTYCHNCKKEFGWFVRKHHCRNCGNIFCYLCASYEIVIPDFIVDRPDPADYWNISHYILSLKKNEEKVCKQCYNGIRGKISAYERIINIFENPVPIDKIKEMSELYADVKHHYFDHLRNIQYYLPNHKYTDVDKKILKINAQNFSKHSKYLVHLIKSISLDQQNIIARSQNLVSDIAGKNLEFIMGVINGEKSKSCDELYCTRTCQESLSFDDCINILYSCIQYLPKQLLEFLFEIIMITPEQVILCHLSFFVTLIKNYGNDKILQLLLFKMLAQSKKSIYHTYWFINASRDRANYQELENINNFIKLFDADLLDTMRGEYLFFVGLIDNLNEPKKYLMNALDQRKPISLPYDPEIHLFSADLDNIIIKSSYTKPVIITFNTNEQGTKKISLLFKREAVTNDITVLNLMTLCDIILKENLTTNFGVVVYPTMTLTANSGMIEIIEKAETIYSIVNNKKNILQHIIERNENRTIAEVLDRYLYSLVSYTLHSYFIGLGDRHLQNIMITDDGAIFHIDFGFILGTEAYPLTATDIKLNAGMLDVIGGQDGKRYTNYLSLCASGVILLRKYFNIFFILLSQDTKFREKHVEKFIMSRFQPRQTDDVVISELLTIINHSHNAYSDRIRDFLHYHTQQKTLQKTVSSMIKNTFGIVKGLTSV